MSDLSIQPVYLSARSAIITPEKSIAVTLYSAQNWLPKLGPERWCLILLLRSLSIDAPRRGDGTKQITCSWRELAELLDVHEETIASWLKHKPIPNEKPWRQIIPVDDKSKFLSMFIPRLRYAYKTHNGKTRRTGFMLEVLMEDPVIPEHESQLRQQMDLLQMEQGKLGLETYRSVETVNTQLSNLPALPKNLEIPNNSDLHYVNQESSNSHVEDNRSYFDLHNDRVNRHNSDLQTNVKQEFVDTGHYVNQTNTGLHNSKPEIPGKNVNELDILIQQIKQKNISKRSSKSEFEPVVRLTETLLNDHHSTAMFYKVLGKLYPERLDLYVAAVRVALHASEDNPDTNLGAVFVSTLREFADVAGVNLGLKASIRNEKPQLSISEPPAPQMSLVGMEPLVPPSVDEAIWSETQAILRRQMTRATFDATIQGTRLLKEENNIFVIGVPSEMTKEWLENRLKDLIQRAISNVVGKSVTVEFRVMHNNKSI